MNESKEPLVHNFIYPLFSPSLDICLLCEYMSGWFVLTIEVYWLLAKTENSNLTDYRVAPAFIQSYSLKSVQFPVCVYSA